MYDWKVIFSDKTQESGDAPSFFEAVIVATWCAQKHTRQASASVLDMVILKRPGS